MHIDKSEFENGVFTVYTQGCNMKCKCCNRLELNKHYSNQDNTQKILYSIKNKEDKITTVVITGGEPTIQDNLLEFLQELKSYNVKVVLKTNGTKVKLINDIINNNLINKICVNIKAPFEKYSLVTDFKERQTNWNCIYKSCLLILRSDIPHVFTMTIIKGIHTNEDIKKVSDTFGGLNNYVIFQQECLD